MPHVGVRVCAYCACSPAGRDRFDCFGCRRSTSSDRSVMIASRTILCAGGSARPRLCTRPSARASGGSSGRTTMLFTGGPWLIAGPGTIDMPSPAETALLIASMLSNSNTGLTPTPPACSQARLQLAVWHALKFEDQRTLCDISRRHLRRNGIVGGGQDRDHRISAHRHRIEVRCFDWQSGETHVDFVGQQRFGYAVVVPVVTVISISG